MLFLLFSVLLFSSPKEDILYFSTVSLSFIFKQYTISFFEQGNFSPDFNGSARSMEKNLETIEEIDK